MELSGDIGIDAFTPETYSQIRVGGNYERTVKNVVTLLRLKESLNAEKPEVFVQFVEMESNKHEKEAFTKFWTEQGAIVKIRPMVSWAGMVEAPNLVLENDERWPCYWAMRSMSITDTGKVVTCAVDLDAQFIAGDVNTASLKEIWKGKLKELRQLHLSKRFDELPENIESIFKNQGEVGLRGLPGIGTRLAGLISRWLGEETSIGTTWDA